MQPALNGSAIAGCDGFTLEPVDEKEFLSMIAEYFQLEWIYEEPSPVSLISEITIETLSNTDEFIVPNVKKIKVLHNLPVFGNIKKFRSKRLIEKNLIPMILGLRIKSMN